MVTTDMYRYLSVCAGIEAFSVAVSDLDFEMAAVAEIEAFPCAVLHHHYGVGRPENVPPEFAKAVSKIPAWSGIGPRNLGDMTRIDTAKLGRIDWLVGGVPCQSYSVAGLRRGLNDERGNLTLEFVRLAHELADGNGLRGLLFENVPGILSDATNAFGCLLGGIVGHNDPLLPGEKPAHGKSNKFWRWIAPGYTPILDDEGEETGEFEEATEGYHRPRWPDAGMVAGPRARLAWRILDSRFFGVAQRRRRVFLVADFGNGPDPAAVLFEPRGQGRSVAAGGEARQEVAGQAGAGAENRVARSLSAEGADASEDGTGRGTPLVAVDIDDRWPAKIAPTLNAHFGDKMGLEDQHALNGAGLFVPHKNPVSVFDPNQITSKDNRSDPEPGMAHTLPATGNAPVLFSVHAIQERATSTNPDSGPDGIGVQADIAYTMEARSTVQAVAFGSKDYGGDAGDISPTLKASGHVGSHANGGAPPAVAFQPKASHHQSMNPTDISPALDKSKEVGIQSGPQVRRLVPEECEKLQGFPVGYTRIPGLYGWRDVGPDENADELRGMGHEVRTNKKTGKSRVNDPDGPRYKSLGNSFTTEPVNWIMSRAQASMRGEPMPPWQPLQLWKTPPV